MYNDDSDDSSHHQPRESLTSQKGWSQTPEAINDFEPTLSSPMKRRSMSPPLRNDWEDESPWKCAKTAVASQECASQLAIESANILREESPHSDQVVPPEKHTGILIVALNIGGYYHIMDNTGIPTDSFLALLGCLQGPAIVTLCDVRLLDKDQLWQNFSRELTYREKRFKARTLRGARKAWNQEDPTQVRGGCALVVSREFFNSPIQPTPNGCDHVEIHVKNWNTRHIDQRLVIIGTYFPYNLLHADRVTGTCKVAANAVAAGNIVVLTGDLNQQQQRAHKQKYGQMLFNAGLQRVETPVTGKQGGKAEGLWMSHPEVVWTGDVAVWKNFNELSDHHCPLVFKVPITISIPKDHVVNLKAEMRKVTNNAKYSAAVNAAKTEVELHTAMLMNTTLPPKYVPYRKYREKKFDMHNPSKEKLRNRIQKQRDFIAQISESRNRRVFREAYYNGPLITNMVKRHKTEVKEFDKSANINMARALVELSWKVAHGVDLQGYFSSHRHLYESADTALKTALVREYTSMEIHAVISRMRHHCVYADFEAKCVHLMGEPALEVVAAIFTRRAHSEVHTTVKKILGIPSGKMHNEKEVIRILQKEFRPIGIAALLDALYFLCQNERVAPVVAQIAPDCMHGFISGREGHDMILEVQALQVLAEIKKEPLFAFTADVEKHFDMLPHEAIEYIDTLMGLEQPFFQYVASQIRSTINHVRVTHGPAGAVHQKSGASQGCHLTPSISALILAPLADALTKHAAASAEAETDPERRDRAKLFRKVSNFADDWQIISNNFKDGHSRFLLAEQMCNVLKIKIKLISITRNGYAILFSPPKLLHNQTTYQWQKATRVLGACIHFQKDSPCAETKCGGKCSNRPDTKICEQCLDQMIINIGALPLPTLDKVEIARKRILSVLEWATYTCPKQQEALLNAATKVRHQLCGYGYGGYTTAAVLPAKLGGYGIEVTDRHIAIQTAAILERCIDRGGTAAELLIMTRKLLNTHTSEHNWHPAIHKALTVVGSLRFDLHPSLYIQPEDHRSQNSPTQIHFYQQKYTADAAYLIVIARSTGGRVQVYHRVENRPQHEQKWTRPPTLRYIRMLARIIEKESEISRYVTLAEPPTGDIQMQIENFSKEKKKYGVKDRVFISVVARTKVLKLTNDDTRWPDIPPPTEDTFTPKAYPISVTYKGESFIKTSLRQETLAKLNLELSLEYIESRQIEELIGSADDGRKIDIDLEASAACAGTLRGVHYDGPMKTNEANKLLQLRTGSLIKSGKSKCECGELLSMKHIAEAHVNDDELEHVLQKTMTVTKYGNINVGLRTHKFLAFGFIPTGFFPKHVPPNKLKEFRRWKLEVAAEFARIGLRTLSLCAPLLMTVAIPEFQIPTGEEEAAKCKYLALADAAIDKTRADERPPVYVYGLGGYVQDGDGNVIKQFMVRREMPIEDSCLGEHCGSLVLTKMVKSLGLESVCFGSDNTAVPSQNRGEWATNSYNSLKVREKTLNLRAEMGMNTDAWFPREANTRADTLSKQALKQTICIPEWYKELDDVLAEIFLLRGDGE